MKDLFYVSTPYHLLLTIGLILDDQQDVPIDIIMSPCFKGRYDYDGIIRSSNKDLTIIESKAISESNNPLENKLSHRKNIDKLATLLKKNEYRKVFVFNDTRPDVQYIIQYYYSKGINDRVYLVEDGIASYVDVITLKKRKIISLGYNKLFYGKWWQDIPVIGTNKGVMNGILLFPDKRSANMLVDNVVMYPRGIRDKIKKNSILRSIINRMSGLEEYNYDVIIVLKQSNRIKKKQFYTREMKELIDKFASEDKVVLVKYHPSEICENYLGTFTSSNVCILPPEISVEYLYLYNEKPFSVIGGISTSLYTCHWFSPNSQSFAIIDNICYLNYSDRNKATRKMLCDKMGINTIEDMKDVWSLVSKKRNL